MRKRQILISMIIILGWMGTSFANSATGITFLQSKQTSTGVIGGSGINGWAVMAFSANGVRNQAAIDALIAEQQSLSSRSTTDVEKQILALVAAGENPRSFAGVNAVDVLKSREGENQFGDGEYLNDDMFGILALKSAGEPVTAALLQTLASNQNSDGGWGLVRGGASSTDMTAVALIALEGYSDQSARDNGLAYVRARQNDDGGFAISSGESSVGSTAWVDWMLVSLNQPRSAWTKNGRTSRDYLLATQESNGSWLNSVLATSYALIALADRGFPYVGSVVRPSPSVAPSPSLAPSVSPSPSPSPSATVSALPTPSISPVSSASPSVHPSPSFVPTLSPSPIPSETVSQGSSAKPSPLASVVPLPTPGASPLDSPIASPVPSPAVTVLAITQPLETPPPIFAQTPRVWYETVWETVTARRPRTASSMVASPSPVLPISTSTQPAVLTSGVVTESEKQNVELADYTRHIFFGGLLLGVNVVATALEVVQAYKKTARHKLGR